MGCCRHVAEILPDLDTQPGRLRHANLFFLFHHGNKQYPSLREYPSTNAGTTASWMRCQEEYAQEKRREGNQATATVVYLLDTSNQNRCCRILQKTKQNKTKRKKETPNPQKGKGRKNGKSSYIEKFELLRRR